MRGFDFPLMGKDNKNIKLLFVNRLFGYNTLLCLANLLTKLKTAMVIIHGNFLFPIALMPYPLMWNKGFHQNLSCNYMVHFSFSHFSQ